MESVCTRELNSGCWQWRLLQGVQGWGVQGWGVQGRAGMGRAGMGRPSQSCWYQALLTPRISGHICWKQTGMRA